MQFDPTIQNFEQGNSPYGYQQPIMSYQDRLAQFQNQYNRPIMPQQRKMMVLNGQIVSCLDEVKAKDVDLSGAPTWYLKADGLEVYRKQLQPDGTSKILTYTLSENSAPEQTQSTVNADLLNALFDQLKQDLVAEISGIKDMFPAQMSETSEPPKTTRGGTQK